ncbi:hypothetical protein U7537_00245 [Lacticaseibacillus rhamnosus]
MKIRTIFASVLLASLPLLIIGCSTNDNQSKDTSPTSNTISKQRVTLLSKLKSNAKQLWYEVDSSKRGTLSTDSRLYHVIFTQNGKITSYTVNSNLSKFANLSIDQAQEKASKDLDEGSKRKTGQGQIQLLMDDSGNDVEGERLDFSKENTGDFNTYTDDHVQLIQPTKILGQYFGGYVYTSNDYPDSVNFMITPVSKNTVIDFDKPGQKYTKRLLKNDQ